MEFVLKYLTSNNDGDFFKKSGREGYVGLRAVVLLWVVFRSLRPLTMAGSEFAKWRSGLVIRVLHSRAVRSILLHPLFFNSSGDPFCLSQYGSCGAMDEDERAPCQVFL